MLRGYSSGLREHNGEVVGDARAGFELDAVAEIEEASRPRQ
jgi:hypothetical protein